MKVKDIMTENPACCSPDSSIQEAAALMKSCDCGEIPVTENNQIIGVITDRDICCRAAADGKDPKSTKVRDIMSAPVVTVHPNADISECCHMMEQKQVRRIPVVDQQNRCCGIVSQADLARAASEHDVAELVKDVSQPTNRPSLVGVS
jgi:CBS domain-containing protein